LNHNPQNSTPKKSNLDKEQPLLFVASPPNKLPTSATYDLPEILSLIRNAEHSLRLQFLSYNNKNRDGTSWNVLDNTLIDAVNRGVHVELMVSDWSKKGSKGASLEKLKQNGVHISIISIPEHSSGPIPFARTIHAKYIVSDTKNCWLGTSNASQGYFTTSRNVGLILKKRTECAQLHQIFTEIQQMQAK
jgi:phosphatidylserine/phosphatidylglycerophosphate/cardiolipin synthase-like enzyme